MMVVISASCACYSQTGSVVYLEQYVDGTAGDNIFYGGEELKGEWGTAMTAPAADNWAFTIRPVFYNYDEEEVTTHDFVNEVTAGATEHATYAWVASAGNAQVELFYWAECEIFSNVHQPADDFDDTPSWDTGYL